MSKGDNLLSPRTAEHEKLKKFGITPPLPPRKATGDSTQSSPEFNTPVGTPPSPSSIPPIQIAPSPPLSGRSSSSSQIKTEKSPRKISLKEQILTGLGDILPTSEEKVGILKNAEKILPDALGDQILYVKNIVKAIRSNATLSKEVRDKAEDFLINVEKEAVLELIRSGKYDPVLNLRTRFIAQNLTTKEELKLLFAHVYINQDDIREGKSYKKILGCFYQYGIGIPVSYKSAIEIYSESDKTFAAALNNEVSQCVDNLKKYRKGKEKNPDLYTKEMDKFVTLDMPADRLSDKEDKKAYAERLNLKQTISEAKEEKVTEVKSTKKPEEQPSSPQSFVSKITPLVSPEQSTKSGASSSTKFTDKIPPIKSITTSGSPQTRPNFLSDLTGNSNFQKGRSSTQ